MLSIIIPTYNESKNILNLLIRLRKVMSNSISLTPEIIVVDDNSPDNTGNIVESYSENNIELQDSERSKTYPRESRGGSFDRNPHTSGRSLAKLVGPEHAQNEARLTPRAPSVRTQTTTDSATSPR